LDLAADYDARVVPVLGQIKISLVSIVDEGMQLREVFIGVEITFLSDAHVVPDENSVWIQYPKRRPNLRANAEPTEELFLIVGQRLIFFEEYVHVTLIVLAEAVSPLLDCETEAGGPKSVTSIKQKPPTTMIENARVLDHVRIPTIG
jgi:hypothetical protein